MLLIFSHKSLQCTKIPWILKTWPGSSVPCLSWPVYLTASTNKLLTEITYF